MIGFFKAALTFLTTYKKYASALLIIAACALCAWLGSSYQKAKCEAQIADFKAQIAIQVKEQERQHAQKLSQAISERDSANARLDSLNRSNSALLDRLRNANNRETERTAEYSKDALTERYEGCRRLLLRGNELAERGSRMVQRLSTDYKALSEVVK